MNLTTLTAREIASHHREKTPILLPLGSVEQHGEFLPTGTKGFLAEAIGFEAAWRLKKKGLTPLVAPTFPYTPCQVSYGFPSNFPIGARTFSDTIFEIGQSFQREGFKWFFPITMTISPEALKAIEVAMEDLNKIADFHAFDPMPLWTFSPNERLADKMLEMGLQPEQEIHADSKETGGMLYLDKDLVKSDLLPGLAPVKASPAWEILKGNFSFLEMGAKDGYLGSPAQATPELGRLFIEEAGFALSEAIKFAMSGNTFPPLPIQLRMLLKMIDLDDM